MKLAEALAERADMQTRLTQLSSRVSGAVVAQEGDEPVEDPKALFAEVDRLLTRLERLMSDINRTNAGTAFDDERSITEAIAARDIALRRFRFYSAAADAATPTANRYSRSEIKMVPTVSVAELRRRADDAAREYRSLDTRLQGLNWTTELLER